MTATITIDRLRLYAYHGVEAQERRVGNWFEVSVRAGVDVALEALEADSLEGTVDYGALCAAVKAEMDHPAALLEHVAWRIVHRLAADFPRIHTLDVAVAKLTPPLGLRVAEVSFSLSWSR